MAVSVYRFTAATTVAIRKQNGFVLSELSAGSMFFPVCAGPDRNRMVTGLCEGHTMLIFERDLEERAEAVVAEQLLTAAAS
jgi:hypothetical protein